MNKNRAGSWLGIAVLFAAVIYSGILFLLKTNFEAAAWVLYAATMISFLLMGAQIVASSRSSSTVVTDSALGMITTVYFAIQLVFGGIIFMFFSDLPLTPVIVAEILLLAVYLIIAFVVFSAQSNSAAQDQKDSQAGRTLRIIESDVRGMVEDVKDPATKKALQGLAEEIHFSNPVNLPGLTGIENQIVQAVAELKQNIESENTNVSSQIDTIRRLLKERDRTAAILKR